MTTNHKLIKSLIVQKPASREELLLLIRKHTKENQTSLPRFASLLKAYRDLLKKQEIHKQPWLEKLLIKRAVRTLSGVAPIHVMTAPLGCPGNCLYCPNEPGMPKSYLSSQPGAMRAILNDFDPYRQVKMRLRALYQNGHYPEKIELIENGGTWTALPRRYRTWFITRCFEAANDFIPENEPDTTDFVHPKDTKTLMQQRMKNQPDHLQRQSLRLQDDDDEDLMQKLITQQTINETATHRMIGITLETRPDWCGDDDILHMRKLGCTKIELGVQNIFDNVLLANNRGHDSNKVRETTETLRDAGFKIAYHVMPSMYKSTPELDKQMFEQLFSDLGLKPDFLKIYPCVVIKQSQLYKLWESGEYKPIDGEKLIDILIEMKKQVPRYCRIARLVRDIPSDSISGGNKVTNLREMIKKELQKQNIKCECIRCREVMGDVTENKLVYNDLEYKTTTATEHFLSFDNKDDDKLYAFLRLRLPKTQNPIIQTHLPELSNCAIIRELHTYGKLAQIDRTDEAQPRLDSDKAQHRGLGKQLMQKAEDITRQHGYKKLAVIAGIGTREYYKKLGYTLQGTYMVKTL